MAKNVLSPEMLSKFKTLKENLLKIIILALNLNLGDQLDKFFKQLLESSQVDNYLKTKIILPISDFKKVDFSPYY